MSNKKRISKRINEINFANKYKFLTFQTACRFVSWLIAREKRKNEIQKKYPLGGFISEKGNEIIVDRSNKIVDIQVPIDVKWQKLSLDDGKELFYVPLELLNLK